jgi:primosomal protein N'
VFVSVIPALKMPYGHGVFDYQLLDGTAHVGDLILVPFRNKLMPALVAKVSPTSEYADKAIALPKPEKIFKFPEAIADFCLAASRECFVSPASMLHAWLRVVPKRLDRDEEAHTPYRAGRRLSGAESIEERLLVNRYAPPTGIIGAAQAEQANGRVLILTPWQSRVPYLQNKLGCPGFHALTAAGAAWKAWTNFLREPNSMLITTRVGAWLAIGADVVIMDEPENDDYKQDELTPRYDSRRLVSLALLSNPSLRTISIGTTPALSRTPNQAPDIDAKLKIEQLGPGARSQLEAINSQTYNTIMEALEDKRAVRILHAVGGARGRVRCADCGWVMTCASCGYGLNNATTDAACRRCGKHEPLPNACPQCKGADLNKSMIGSDLLQQHVAQHFPGADVKVVDLQEWPTQGVPPQSLVVVTNLGLIGGYTEDIRRKERLIIAFRRLAAQISLAQCELIVQGPENLLQECASWLTSQGLHAAWQKEWDDRLAFNYPPARPLVKLIITGQLDNPDAQTVELTDQLGLDWQVQGPFKVENRAENREPRVVYHLLPPPETPREAMVQKLIPLAKLGILDLDPIGFFS